MTTATHHHPPAVAGGPRAWLRLDGLVLFAASIILFGQTHQTWWLVPLLLLVPDLAIVGYVVSPRVGALLYNAGHTYLLPAAMAVAGVLADRPLVLGLALIWLAHIGMDRVAGYGLKYPSDFTDTHLGRIGKHQRDAAPQRPTPVG